jgi:hypothetical protein
MYCLNSLSSLPQQLSNTEVGDPRPIRSAQLLPGWPSHRSPALPVGFADLCLSSEIAPHVMTILKGTARIFSMGVTRHASLQRNLPSWSREDSRLRNITTMDKLLLHGLIAYYLQGGFEHPIWFYPVSYTGMEKYLTSINRMELAAIAKERCLRDTLVWIYLCVAGALQNYAQNYEETRNEKEYPSYVVLRQIFCLIENPIHLSWCNIVPIMRRFWLPTRLEQSWEQCWNNSIGKWQVSSII